MANPRTAATDREVSTRTTRSTAKSINQSTADEPSSSLLKAPVRPRKQKAVVVEVAVKADNIASVANFKTEKLDAINKTGSIATQDGGRLGKVEKLNDKENVPPVIRNTRVERQSKRVSSSDDQRRIESEPEASPSANPQGVDSSDQDLASSGTADVQGTTKTNIELHALESIDHKNSNKKRKWSRPTRVVKLEEANNGSSESHSDTESESGKGEDRMDSDGEYGVRKRVANGSGEPRRIKASRNQVQELSEYERLRLENIRRNQEMLQFLQLPSVANEIQMAIIEGKPVDTVAVSGENADGTPAPVRMKRQNIKKAPKIVQPVRTSNRIRGVAVTPLEIGENDMLDPESRSQTQSSSIKMMTKSESDDEGSDRDDEDPANLMSGDLFFDKETRDRAIRVDGHYKGWLNSEVMVKYGFEKSAEDAWEANGGGTFSFSDPSGSSTAGSSKKSARRPKHDAKMVAKAMFKKNPNSFFYRHNEPGQEQWTGDWTEPERELFLQVAREHGCGDKWGLFASHIPHRVGYQCSNFYRQVVLPEGLVFDPNYEYTSRGKPIYCGKYNQRRN
ncbi:hypothetical protein BGZ72_009740 [Mortierella alpina]|nr:hypothetical protein BGZ72_009740 [Mortierella alpina]